MIPKGRPDGERPGLAARSSSGRSGQRRGLVCVALLLGILCGAGLAVAAWFLFTPRYESSATLLFTLPNEKLAPAAGSDSTNYVAHAIATIKYSPVVLDKALDDATVKNLPLVKSAGPIDPADWLSDRLTVEYVGGGVVKVLLRGDSPDGLQEVLTALLNAYKTETIERERSAKVARHDRLELLIKDGKNQLMELLRQQFLVGQQFGDSDFTAGPTNIKLARESLEEMQRRRAELEKALGELNQKVDLLIRTRDNAAVATIPRDKLAETLAKDPSMIQVNADLAALTRQLREIEDTHKDKKDPAILRLKDQIRSLEEGIETMRSAIVKVLVEQSRGELKESDEIRALNLKILFYQEKIDDLTAEIAKQAKKVQDLDRFSGEFEQLSDDIQSKRSFIRLMADQLDRSEAELVPPIHGCLFRRPPARHDRSILGPDPVQSGRASRGSWASAWRFLESFSVA